MNAGFHGLHLSAGVACPTVLVLIGLMAIEGEYTFLTRVISFKP